MIDQRKELEAVEKGCQTLEFAVEVAIKRYPSDLKDKEWNILEPLLPQATGQGRPREYPWREVVNAMFYITRSGCSWRMMPSDLPYWVTVYHYFRKWRKTGLWQNINDILRARVREKLGRDKQPSAGILDSLKCQNQ